MAGALGDAVGQLGFGQVGGKLGTFGVAIALILLGGIIIGGALFAYMYYKKYNKTIILFGRVGNKVEKIGQTKAAEISLNREGDKVFQIIKNKKLIPYPSISSGKNTYWFFVADDGEWINVGLEDFNEKLKEIKLYALHTDMRYARSSLRSSLKERYDKTSFLQKFGPAIAMTLFFLIAGIGFWLLLSKMTEVTNSLGGAIEAAKQVAEYNRQAAGALAQAGSGSGIVASLFPFLLFKRKNLGGN